MTSKMKVALTIAGSDSGGGAGIQADIKAMQANGVFATSVITAVTAQNTRAVISAYELPLHVISAQIDAIYDDIEVHAAKTGMLSSSRIIRTVSRKIRRHHIRPLVVDPVMISKSGYALLHEDAIATLKKRLLPLATLVTPNLHEAQLLAGRGIQTLDDAADAAKRIHALGPEAVLVKGGHLRSHTGATDILFDGNEIHTFSQPFVESKHTHGTGCTYSAAIAANLAMGYELKESIDRAKRYVTKAIQNGLEIGGGVGPTNHFYFLEGISVL